MARPLLLQAGAQRKGADEEERRQHGLRAAHQPPDRWAITDGLSNNATSRTLNTSCEVRAPSEGERETLNDSRTHTGGVHLGREKERQAALRTLPRVSLPPPHPSTARVFASEAFP